MLVSVVGGGTVAFAAGAAVLDDVTACFSVAAVTLLAAVLAICWFWATLWVTVEYGCTLGVLFTKLYFAVV